MERTIEVTEIAWAAGFFDGEGCLSIHTQRSGSKSLVMNIGQAGTPVCLERFQKAVGGVGTIYGPYKPGKNSKQDVYMYKVHTCAGITHIVDVLWSYLSEPKRKQIEEVKQRLCSMKDRRSGILDS